MKSPGLWIEFPIMAAFCSPFRSNENMVLKDLYKVGTLYHSYVCFVEPFIVLKILYLGGKKGVIQYYFYFILAIWFLYVKCSYNVHLLKVETHIGWCYGIWTFAKFLGLLAFLILKHLYTWVRARTILMTIILLISCSIWLFSFPDSLKCYTIYFGRWFVFVHVH